MEYSTAQQTETLIREDARRVQLIGARALSSERAAVDEPRFVLNARGQAFVADTLGIVCDSPLSNAEISLIAEKIEQNLSDVVPYASLLIQLAVVGQTPAEISKVTDMSPTTASRYLRAIRRASNTASQALIAPTVAPAPELVEPEVVLAVVEQPSEEDEEVIEVLPVVIEPVNVPIEPADEVLLEEELPLQEFHFVAAGSLRGAVYRALKERGIKGYGVIELPQLAEYVESALRVAAAPRADRQAYRDYLQTNKLPFVDNPARSLIADAPQLIAEIIAQELAARPMTIEPVVTPPVVVEQVPPARPVRRRVGRAAAARTPLRTAPTAAPKVRQRPITEQLPLDVVAMNRLRGGVFRALRGLGVALPSSLEHEQLHDYARQVMADKLVSSEIQTTYERYLRTCSYARSDSELNQTVAVMPEWIAQQIMSERGEAPGTAIGPEVLTGQRELHMAERQRIMAIAAAELEAARAYLSGTDWERHQALISVGGDLHWLSLFDTWCAGSDPEVIAADSQHDAGMVRRQLLHMAKAAHRKKPGSVVVPPSIDWAQDALCAQTDPEIFFPEKGISARDPKKVCEQCDVQTACEAYAKYHQERFGVWGHKSNGERKPRPSRSVE